MQELADFLQRFGAYFWLLETVPSLLVAAIAFGEGHRLVLAAQVEDTSDSGPRLLRTCGFVLSLCLFCFAVVGVLAIVSLVQVPFMSIPFPTAVNLRRIMGTLVFFITPASLGYLSWRLLRFVSPRRLV